VNKFNESFFAKYVPEWQKFKDIIHAHPIQIILSLLVKIWLFVIIPVVFYYYSPRFQVVQFVYIEIYLILVYIKIIYDIFDWYNDAWIITNEWIIYLKWSLLKTKIDTIKFDAIEWFWVEQDWFIDKILKKWDLVIDKIWEEDDALVLRNATNPYKAVDLIEAVKNERDDPTEDDKFDMIMDSLNWVVWDYLTKNKTVIKEQKDDENYKKDEIEKIMKSEGTINLM
jgi:hypothetical protein